MGSRKVPKLLVEKFDKLDKLDDMSTNEPEIMDFVID